MAKLDPEWAISEIDQFLQLTAQVAPNVGPNIAYFGTVMRGSETDASARAHVVEQILDRVLPGWSKDRPVKAVLAETMAQFDAMSATVAAMPADDLLTPGCFAWLGNLPIGPAVLGYSFTHLHTDHAPDIRVWLRRETGSDPVLPPAPPTFGYGE